MTYNVALSGGNITTLQTENHAADYYLSVASQGTFATARINQASFDTPLAELTVDNASGTFTSAVRGQTVWIGTTAGARDVGVYRLRATPTSTNMKLMEVSPGDPGLLARRELKPLADNQHITIIDDFNLFSVFPNIVYSGGAGTYYKDKDIAYASQNEAAGVPAILRIGEHRTGFVDATTGLLTTAWTASLTLYAGVTAAGYAWEVDGGTVTVGATNQSSLTVTHTYGEYIIRCTVTLSNGATVHAARRIWAHDPVLFPPLNVNMTSYRETLQGALFSFELADDFDSDLLTGSMVMLWEDTASTAIASATTKAVGFVESIDGGIDLDVSRASVNVISPLEYLRTIKGFSMELKVAADPSTWLEVISTLAHIDFFVFYILYWHTTLLTLFDLNPSGLTSYTRYLWTAQPGNWLDSIHSATKQVKGMELTQHPHGGLYLMPDPQLLTAAERAALIERWGLVEDDVREGVSYTHRLHNVVGKVEVLGFSLATTLAGTSAYRYIAMGTVGGQADREGQPVTFIDSEANIAARAGCVFASENNPYPRLTIPLMTGYSVISPAMRYFVPIDIDDSELLPEGEVLDFRLVPLEITIDYTVDESGDVARRVTLIAEAETIGYNTPGQSAPLLARDGITIANLPALNSLGIPVFSLDPFNWGGLNYGLPRLPAFNLAASRTGTPGTSETPDIASTYAYAWAVTGSAFVEDWTVDTPVWSARSANTVFCGVKGEGARIYEAQDDGFYYAADILTDTPALMTSGTFDRAIIRPGQNTGQLGGAAVTFDSTWSYAFNFASDDHDWFTVVGSYSGGTGFIHGDEASRRRVVIRRNTPRFTMTQIDIVYDLSLGDSPRLLLEATLPSVDELLDTTSPTTGTNVNASSGTGTVTTEQINCELRSDNANPLDGSATVKSLTIHGTGYNPFEDMVKLVYTADHFGTVHYTDVAPYWLNETGYDMDSHNLGVHVVAANRKLWCTSSYTGSAIEITGLTGLPDDLVLQAGATEYITAVRIPYLTSSGAVNNSKTALEVIYSVSSGYIGRFTLNANTGAASGETDISYAGYYVVGGADNANGDALETFGDDAGRIIAAMKQVGGSGRIIAGTTNGGTGWTNLGTVPVSALFVRFVEPSQDGTGLQFFAAGSSVQYTDTFDATDPGMDNKTGNLATAAGGSAYRGAFVV